MKLFFAALLSLQFLVEFFWQKEIGKKAAHKMLVKLTTVKCGKTFQTKFHALGQACQTGGKQAIATPLRPHCLYNVAGNYPFLYDSKSRFM